MNPAATIIYADDEPRFLRLVKLFLEPDGYELLCAADGKEALELLGRRPDTALVILDAMMPVMDGWKACKAIRSFSKVPVMMLTALGDETNEIRGIGAGADDYLPKPFSRDRLRARISALLRRSRMDAPAVLDAGGIRLDAGLRDAILAEGPAGLGFREFELLRCLMRNEGTILPRDRLLDLVWGYGYEGDPRTLDTHIKSIRRKLGPAGSRIITSRGVGYGFQAEARGLRAEAR